MARIFFLDTTETLVLKTPINVSALVASCFQSFHSFSFKTYEMFSVVMCKLYKQRGSDLVNCSFSSFQNLLLLSTFVAQQLFKKVMVLHER